MNSLQMTEKEFALYCLAQAMVPFNPTIEQLEAVAKVAEVSPESLIEQYKNVQERK